MISAEFLSGLGYVLASLSNTFGFPGPEIASFPLNITFDCFPKYEFIIWEFELEYPVYAILMILGDLSMYMAKLTNS